MSLSMICHIVVLSIISTMAHGERSGGLLRHPVVELWTRKQSALSTAENMKTNRMATGIDENSSHQDDPHIVHSQELHNSSSPPRGPQSQTFRRLLRGIAFVPRRRSSQMEQEDPEVMKSTSSLDEASSTPGRTSRRRLQGGGGSNFTLFLILMMFTAGFCLCIFGKIDVDGEKERAKEEAREKEEKKQREEERKNAGTRGAVTRLSRVVPEPSPQSSPLVNAPDPAPFIWGGAPAVGGKKARESTGNLGAPMGRGGPGSSRRQSVAGGRRASMAQGVKKARPSKKKSFSKSHGLLSGQKPKNFFLACLSDESLDLDLDQSGLLQMSGIGREHPGPGSPGGAGLLGSRDSPTANVLMKSLGFFQQEDTGFFDALSDSPNNSKQVDQLNSLSLSGGGKASRNSDARVSFVVNSVGVAGRKSARMSRRSRVSGTSRASATYSTPVSPRKLAPVVEADLSWADLNSHLPPRLSGIADDERRSSLVGGRRLPSIVIPNNNIELDETIKSPRDGSRGSAASTDANFSALSTASEER